MTREAPTEPLRRLQETLDKEKHCPSCESDEVEPIPDSDMMRCGMCGLNWKWEGQQ